MTLFLLRGCDQARKRLAAANDSTTPIASPTPASSEEVTLYLANDSENSLKTVTRHLALPQEPTLCARAILQQLMAEYAGPDSTHPLPKGPPIDDIFLLNLPIGEATQTDPDTAQLAIVNLHGAFVAAHPSNAAAEDLTLQSIIETLHASFPQLTQISFLVDGQPHDTLAGHTSLKPAYAAIGTDSKPTPVTPASTQP